MAGGATVGSGRAYRLDPATLPARGSPMGGDAAATFTIEADRAIVRSGGAVRDVPLREYRGVAVRMEPIGSDGSVRGFVELLHAEPELTLPLAIADDPNIVANDWQAWGRALNLPLLIIGQDGSIGEPLKGDDAIFIGASKPRRRHSYFAKRRPRFLTRRKIGQLDAVRVVIADEIFGTRH